MPVKNKIAFIHYPHAANSARLDTMPFALNSVLALAKMGWEVDVFVWEEKSPHYQDILPKNVVISYFQLPPTIFSNRIQAIWHLRQFIWRNNYVCAFGLGQIGIYLADLIARASHCPLVYLNDEFPSHWYKNFWSITENQCAVRSQVIIVPDIQRIQPLHAELHGTSLEQYNVLPNIPIIDTIPAINWHEKLGLPDGSIPFLHAGSVADWAQIPELLSTVPYWHDQAVLVIHSRSSENMLDYRQSLSHLEISHKIFWTSEPFSIMELNSLVAYCAASFALYRNTGLNIEYVGFSSGKLMRSLACRSPVIASELSSLSFVAEHNLGILVSHPADIPNAIDRIIQNRDEYSKRCSDFCQTYASFERYWQEFHQKLAAVAQFDLTSSSDR